MKVQIVMMLIIAGLSLSNQEIITQISDHIDGGSCKHHGNLTNGYRDAYNDYMIVIYKLISAQSNVNFAFSPNSLWLALAAMAEGADTTTRRQLFQFLDLPDDWSVRQEYYKLARECVLPRSNIGIKRDTVLIVDNGLAVNTHWENLISDHSLLHVLDLPIKSDPEVSIKIMEHIISAPLDGLNLTGNSVILDAVDYNGLWRTAFADAVDERSPFYNLQGEQIGYVDLMRMKKRVRMNYIPAEGAKILELPVGADSRYRMIFATFESPVDILSKIMKISKEMVMDVVNNLQETDEPVDVAIPRIAVMSRIDVRRILEGVGIQGLWNEEAATRFISEPAALPSSFVQRASITLNTGGVDPTSSQELPYVSPRDITKGFVANRPFLFSLFDAETYSCLIAVGVTEPTYPN